MGLFVLRKRKIKLLPALLLSALLLTLTACHTTRNIQYAPSRPIPSENSRHGRETNTRESYGSHAAKMVDEAAVRLGLKPDYRRDNGRLLTECASWVGTPYRYGGNTKAGVDCSALTLNIYNKVYGKKLHRRSRDQFEKDVRRITRDDMQQGDLVFFTSPRSGGFCGHVGIYLRDGYFLHASSSRGVVVSHLDGNYYRQHWLGAGRVPDDDLHDPSSALP